MKNRGSTMLYAVFLLLILLVFAAGYQTVAAGAVHSSLRTYGYARALYAVKNLHRSYCQAVAEGETETVLALQERIGRDLRELQSDGGEEQEDAREEGWKELLSGRRYVLCARAEAADGTEIAITLTYRPDEETAIVRTEAEADGYRAALNAQIRLSWAELDADGLPIYDEGEVVRYYDDGE